MLSSKCSRNNKRKDAACDQPKNCIDGGSVLSTIGGGGAVETGEKDKQEGSPEKGEQVTAVIRIEIVRFDCFGIGKKLWTWHR